jgi:hypothetical protein
VIQAKEKPKEGTKKPANIVNPHTGKADPEWTKKMQNIESGKKKF